MGSHAAEYWRRDLAATSAISIGFVDQDDHDNSWVANGRQAGKPSDMALVVILPFSNTRAVPVFRDAIIVNVGIGCGAALLGNSLHHGDYLTGIVCIENC